MIEALLTLLLVDLENPRHIVSKSISFNAQHYTCEKVIKGETKMLEIDETSKKHYFLTKNGKQAVLATICPDWRKK